MKPASRKFKNQGTGVYRKNLHGWGMVEARQQSKLKKLAAGHKVHQEGPKEYRVNAPTKKRPNPKAKKQSPVYRIKAIKEQADPWLGTQQITKKQIRNELGLKNIPTWRASTNNYTDINKRLRIQTLLSDLPQVITKHVLQILPKLVSSKYSICKNRILAVAFLVWYDISKIEVARFQSIAPLRRKSTNWDKYLLQARDILDSDLSDSDIHAIFLEYRDMIRPHRLRPGAGGPTHREKASSTEWRAIRIREAWRRHSEKETRENQLWVFFAGIHTKRHETKSKATLNWRKNNPEKVRAYNKKYRKPNKRKRNKEKDREYSRQYRLKNKAKSLKQSRDHYAKNKDKINARNRAKYKTKPKRIRDKKRDREYSRKYRLNNPEKTRAYDRAWRAKNKDRINAKRRAAHKSKK